VQISAGSKISLL
jgi:hypothetical protein